MKSIVFCSSQRFKNELAEFISELKRLADQKEVHISIFDPEFDKDNGGPAAEPGLHLLHEKDRMKNPDYKKTVAERVYDHLFRKVRVADVCFIFNKDGYVGANTNGELFAAATLGKTVYSLEDSIMMGNHPHDLYEEPSSRKLIHDVVSTPGDLLKRLH